MKADEYRRHAEAVLERAAGAATPLEREQYLRMAAGWKDLADAAERDAKRGEDWSPPGGAKSD